MRRRAFTLIELMVVCTVLVIVAALVLPNVVAMKASRERQVAYDDVLRIAQLGREVAIQSGKTYVLTLTDGGATVVLNREEEAESIRDTRTTAIGAGDPQVQEYKLPTGVLVGSNANTSVTSGANSQAGGSGDGASAGLPDGVTTGDVILDGKSSTTADFQLHFYPDGRSEGGGFEMVDGAVTRNLFVDRYGLATLGTGRLPTATENSWEAGQYEQRSSS